MTKFLRMALVSNAVALGLAQVDLPAGPDARANEINTLKLNCVEDIRAKVPDRPNCAYLKEKYDLRMTKEEMKEIVEEQSRRNKCFTIEASKKRQCDDLLARMERIKPNCRNKTDPECSHLKDLRHQLHLLTGETSSKKGAGGDDDNDQRSEDEKRLQRLKFDCKQSKSRFQKTNYKVKTSECQAYEAALLNDPDYVNKRKNKDRTKPSKEERAQAKQQKIKERIEEPCNTIRSNSERMKCKSTYQQITALKKVCKSAKLSPHQRNSLEPCNLMKELLATVPQAYKPNKGDFQRPGTETGTASPDGGSRGKAKNKGTRRNLGEDSDYAQPEQEDPTYFKDPSFVEKLYAARSFDPESTFSFDEPEYESAAEEGGSWYEPDEGVDQESGTPSPPELEEDSVPTFSFAPRRAGLPSSNSPATGSISPPAPVQLSNRCPELIASGTINWTMEFCQQFYQALDQSRIACKIQKQAGDKHGESLECLEYKERLLRLPVGFGAPQKASVDRRRTLKRGSGRTPSNASSWTFADLEDDYDEEEP